MQFSTLNEWLTFISSIHTTEIDLTLARVSKVAKQLRILQPACPVIIVGGTNGKGSTVKGLESIYLTAGYKVGTFTSPFLFQFNEQIRIQGKDAQDKVICDAFFQIEAARGSISLTPFEFHTLAALFIFTQQNLDIWILEVGLGGRLDAVNIINADIAIVTTVAMDHIDYLGSTREEIGWEKAGIFRENKAALCGDFNPPKSLMNYAEKIGAPLFFQGTDFRYREETTHWSWQWQDTYYDILPFSILATQNMSTVLMAITLLQQQLIVPQQAIQSGLMTTKLTGRQEIVSGPITHIYDVSHNPAAIAFLAQRLMQLPCIGKTHAVFSMLSDKDLVASLYEIALHIDQWYVGQISHQRGAVLAMLQVGFQQASLIEKTDFFTTLSMAYQAALQKAQPGDRIVIFGSFHTVAEVYTRSE